MTCSFSSSWLSVFFFSSRRRHTRLQGDWSSDVCSSDLTSAARTPTRTTHGVGPRPATHRCAGTSRTPTAAVCATRLSCTGPTASRPGVRRSEEHTSELQSPCNLVCRLLLEKKKTLRVLSIIRLAIVVIRLVDLFFVLLPHLAHVLLIEGTYTIPHLTELADIPGNARHFM